MKREMHWLHGPTAQAVAKAPSAPVPSAGWLVFGPKSRRLIPADEFKIGCVTRMACIDAQSPKNRDLIHRFGTATHRRAQRQAEEARTKAHQASAFLKDLGL